MNFLSFIGHDGPEKDSCPCGGEMMCVLHDTSFEETVSEDQEHTDVVVCLPDVDSLTDDDEGSDIVIGIVDIQCVPVAVENHLFSEACKNKEQADLLPTTIR
jgi:hypothetical protein